jgi:short-subunit dehydrogenase
MTITPNPLEPMGLAVVTGASTGIGFSLAKDLVRRAFDVVICAEEPVIHDRASELALSGRAVVPVQADLSTSDGVQSLYLETQRLGRPIEILALNAGIGVNGRFTDTPLEDDLRVVDLNVRSTVHLAKLVGRDMVQRRHGRILVTSSVAAVAPGPFHATYAASKAFVHSFAEAIRVELKDTGVTVTSLMPGPTDTDFFRRADMEDTRVGSGPKDDPDEVAEDGLDALFAGKDSVVAGSFRNRVQAEAGTHLPDKIASAVMARMLKPR